MMKQELTRRSISLFWLAAFCCGAASVRAGLPNIVIIDTDDMGYGEMDIQNPKSKIPAPHPDELAREGMRFTDLQRDLFNATLRQHDSRRAAASALRNDEHRERFRQTKTKNE